MSDNSPREPADEEKRREIISGTAYTRILALHDQEMHAARMIGDRSCYADFYCEGEPGHPPFHETFAPPDAPPDLEQEGLRRKLRQRMQRLDSGFLSRAASRRPFDEGPYNDFFADSLPNGPWHEAWEELVQIPIAAPGSIEARSSNLDPPVGRSLANDPDARARALSKLKVVRAYLRLRERTLTEEDSPPTEEDSPPTEEDSPPTEG